MTTLADYFCKGRFHRPPALSQPTAFSDEGIRHHLLRATSGRGIVNLHHTITFYALQRVKQFFSAEEYQHLTGAWISFLKNKNIDSPLTIEKMGTPVLYSYSDFQLLTSKRP